MYFVCWPSGVYLYNMKYYITYRCQTKPYDINLVNDLYMLNKPISSEYYCIVRTPLWQYFYKALAWILRCVSVLVTKRCF